MILPVFSVVLLTAAAPQQRIAVMDVVVRAGVDANVGQVLSDDLVTEVRKRRPHSSIVSAGEIRSMLAIQGERQRMGCASGSTDACLAEIGGALGAEEMVTSTLGKLGRTFVFSLKLFDVPHGRVIREASAKLETKEDDALLETVSTLVAQLFPLEAVPRPAPQPGVTLTEPVASSAPAHHSHVPAILLGVGGLAAAAVAVVGFIQLASDNNTVSSYNTGTPGLTLSQFNNAKGAAPIWDAVGIGMTVLAAAGLTTAVIAW